MPRILIVEDEGRIAALLERGLRRYGFETEVSATGDDGLQRLLEAEFDLCLLDLRLPGKNGLDVLSEARAGGVTLPIMILSAWCDRETRATSLARGANDVVDKPFEFKDLLARIQSQLTSP
ncbi:MAG: response regulator transcription factor [Cyanobacteria bacterium P01_D01_bin.123]